MDEIFEAFQMATKSCQFGRLLLKAGMVQKAVKHLQNAVELAPAMVSAHVNLARALSRLPGDEKEKDNIRSAITHLCSAVRLRPDETEIWIDLGALYTRLQQHDLGLRCSNAALVLDPKACSAKYNKATALRCLGRHDEALLWTQREIEKDIGTAIDVIRLQNAPRLPVATLKATTMAIVTATTMATTTVATTTPDTTVTSTALSTATAASAATTCAGETSAGSATGGVTVVCVKWGSKYGADYVNRLHRAVRRHLPAARSFVCLTDDPKGLEAGITPRALPGGWTGWWNKIVLFSPDSGLRGRVLYIDLDTVITASLAPVLSYTGVFATLTPRDFANEARQEGYNSSVVLWDTERFGHQLFRFASAHYPAISACIHRLDHYLELMVRGADLLQDLFPDMFVEFSHDCRSGLPAGASLVNFPLRPKPHEVSVAWVHTHWTNLLPKDDTMIQA